MFIEIIFVLLGLLVVWLGLTGHIFFDRHKLSWLILSLALILWGLRDFTLSRGEAAGTGGLHSGNFVDALG